jgi:Fic family protein
LEKKHFTNKSTGKLINITVGDKNDWAFIPEPLPDKWDIPRNIWPLLVQAREELARLDGIGRHMPEYDLLLRPLQQREALKSSSLEGTYASPVQLLLFEMDPREPKTKEDKTNAWKEVFNYGNAIRFGKKTLEEIPVSLRFIKILHKELLEGVRGHHRDPGSFRKSQVHIGSDRRFIPPPPNMVVECLHKLEKYIHSDHSIDPLVFCFMVHYQFEAIHPFLDGNGRVGRLLLSLMIYQWCKLKNPWLYLSAFFDKYKEEYILNLYNISTKGDWESWITYCLRATIYQSKDAIKRFDHLVLLRNKYHHFISQCGGNARLNTLIDRLFKIPAITIPQLSDMLGVSYPTAKNDLNMLTEMNILQVTNINQRPKVYISPEIIDIAYGDDIDYQKKI